MLDPSFTLHTRGADMNLRPLIPFSQVLLPAMYLLTSGQISPLDSRRAATVPAATGRSSRTC
eukprot:9471640-Pyramimonas_sp.AAC.1